eukprot:Selendium_serpulae@DN5206_c0_g1_i11.p1
MDAAEKIVEEGLAQHKQMIKELKGAAGVTPDRFSKALTVRHCALSLVGEPIMYPAINELLTKLHQLNISTFVVTNGQFPDAIRSLIPVTQLYVSIDAADKETLKKIDRPLHLDFWERYMESLDCLRSKKQRTVYRLTLVRGKNMEQGVDGYARLIERGQPSFIEIKGVTYSGASKTSDITMKSVPWHSEVVQFAEELVAALPKSLAAQYEVAAVHEHSVSVLVADKRFYQNDTWCTWIDYDKFAELVNSGGPFTDVDYSMPTPQWALKGAAEAGFDPDDTRHIAKGIKKRMLKAAEKAAMEEPAT